MSTTNQLSASKQEKSLAAILASLAGLRSMGIQTGRATMSGGTVTVTANVTSASAIVVSRDTPGGTLGNISVPSASRTGTSFVINSSSGSESSTFDWIAIG